MSVHRFAARMAQLAGPLVCSLPLLGCDRPPAIAPRNTSSLHSAPRLVACPDPVLKEVWSGADGAQADDCLTAAAYPAAQQTEPSPRLVRRLPAAMVEPSRPLEAPRAIIGDALAVPMPADEALPQLIAAGSPAMSPPAHGELATHEQQRPPEMDTVARQAGVHVRRGYELAARGALFSARAEFVQALRLIAQAWDLHGQTRGHSQALAAGLQALREADDFVPRGSRLEADLDVLALAAAHQTPVLKRALADGPALHSPAPASCALTRVEAGESSCRDDVPAAMALQRYYTYAQEQLGAAAGGEDAGSMALYGLGKLYSTLAAQPAQSVVAARPTAMVFHQAALATSPRNYMAANELAVLLAWYGRFEPARELLRHSLRVSPQPATWRNLAAVHRQLGEVALAELAEREATRADGSLAVSGQAARPSQTAPVEWVDSSTFARTSKPAAKIELPSSRAQPAPIAPAPIAPTLRPTAGQSPRSLWQPLWPHRRKPAIH